MCRHAQQCMFLIEMWPRHLGLFSLLSQGQAHIFFTTFLMRSLIMTANYRKYLPDISSSLTQKHARASLHIYRLHVPEPMCKCTFKKEDSLVVPYIYCILQFTLRSPSLKDFFLNCLQNSYFSKGEKICKSGIRTGTRLLFSPQLTN